MESSREAKDSMETVLPEVVAGEAKQQVESALAAIAIIVEDADEEAFCAIRISAQLETLSFVRQWTKYFIPSDA